METKEQVIDFLLKEKAKVEEKMHYVSGAFERDKLAKYLRDINAQLEYLGWG